jgi:dephospho-CoA kinase
MIKIGVTGLIAGGKSEFCKYLNEYTKYPIIDADELARQVSAKGSEAAAEIEMTFGKEYITDGEIDRKKLAELVFNNKEALFKLNSILHYRIGEKYLELAKRYEDIGIEGIIYDCPLLVQANAENTVDIIVLVVSDYDVRLRRLTEIRKMSVKEATSRINNQIPYEEQKKYADIIVENNGSKDELKADIPEIFARIKEVLNGKKLLHN